MNNDVATFVTVFLGLILPLLSIGGIYVWDKQQVRSTYMTAYTKNMECRVATTQSRGSDFVNKVCGEIPKLGDFKNG